MFGYRENDELRNTDLLQVIAEESRQAILNHIRQYMKSPAQYRMFEGMGLRRDGTVFSVELRAFPTVFQEQRAQQMTFRDITHKKKMEEQLIQSERLAATGKLAMDIAHEINNPLGGILTYTHLVLEDLEEESIQKQNVKKILKLANRCKIIVRGLLDFARDDSDIKEPVDVNDLIRETLYLIQGHVIMNNVKLALDLEENLPTLWAVRVKLEQVFLNLVVNAAEAMEGQGGLSITSEYVRSKNIVRVQFSDTGHGVHPEHLKKVFEPFFTTKKRGRGTGLGLSISHGIIKQHNGALYAESHPEDGSTFTIELPV